MDLRALETLGQDIRYAVRQLRRNPRFTLAAVLTLALGTGATTATFTVASAVLFRDLPYRDPAQLVQFWTAFRQHGMDRVVFSHLEYLDYRSRTRSFSDLAAYGQNTQTLKANGEPEQVWLSDVSTNLFDMLGVSPIFGRTFSPDDSENGRSRVVILGHGLWQRRFGSDPKAVGSTLLLQGEPHTIVGVMPATFRSPASLAELWRPIVFGGEMVAAPQRGSRSLSMIGRLRPGVPIDGGRREMATLAEQIANEHREQYPQELGYSVALVPLHEEVTGGVRRALLVLLAAVGMVMLIACANVANLLLTRATERHTEMAVRATLGASRGRMVSQMFTESLVLGLLGGAAGTLLALWGVDILLASVPPGVLPRLDEVTVSAPLFWFSLALSLAASLLFGLAPAAEASSTSLGDRLKEGHRTGLSRPRSTLRSLLIVSEVALALVLLAGAGLLIRSYARLTSVPSGFDAGGSLTLRISLPPEKYPSRAHQQAFFDAAAERVGALPGVQAIGLVTSLPFSGWRNDWSISLEGITSMDEREGRSLPAANYFAVNREYFRAMGIPVVQGRTFETADATSTPTVLVNQTLANRFWPGQTPLGKRLKMGGATSRWPWRSIVGVVGDVRQTNLETAMMPEIFVLDADERKPMAPAMFMVVRAGEDAMKLTPAIRRAVAALDPDQAVSSVRMLSDRVSLTLAERRFQLLLLAVFAGIAVALAAVGVYGVVACSVGQRTRELGLRFALGAQRADVFRLVIGQGMRLTAIGVAAGVAGALALSRFLESLLFEMAPTDPLTFVAVAAMLTLVALLATWIPARRASRVDPVEALRL